MVGATFSDCQAGGDCGSAYVFEKPAGGWAGALTEAAKLTASDAAVSDQFGAVSISGDTVVVGAQFDDCMAGVDCGSAYVFEKPAGGWAGALTRGRYADRQRRGGRQPIRLGFHLRGHRRGGGRVR